MTKCYNCGEIKDEKYFRYLNETYCFECIKEHFFSELVEQYFDNFLYEECEEV